MYPNVQINDYRNSCLNIRINIYTDNTTLAGDKEVVGGEGEGADPFLREAQKATRESTNKSNPRQKIANQSLAIGKMKIASKNRTRGSQVYDRHQVFPQRLPKTKEREASKGNARINKQIEAGTKNSKSK